MAKRPIEDRRYYSGHQEPIDSIELSMPRVIDARRLMTARALMQEAMTEDVTGNIIWVGPEANGKRIKEYIERQNHYEASQPPLTNSKDMEKFCQPEEKGKVEKYKHTWGLNNKIRHYSKTDKGWSLADQKPIY